MTQSDQTLTAGDIARKPSNTELDVHGLTHRGLMRPNNEDNFLLASLHKHVTVKSSSLPSELLMQHGDDRLAFIAVVADGVGGGELGEVASRLAISTASQYISEAIRCFYGTSADEATLTAALQATAQGCHEAVCQRAEVEGVRNMATTLTLFLGVWPAIYLLQVGDSRYYQFHDGALQQISRDQTMAQEMIDLGVLPAERAGASRLANVLSSAIGGQTSVPIVTRLQNAWGDVHLLCSDGLTKHVKDARIADVLGSMTSAKQACEQLLQEALDDGGSDNITIVVGRAIHAS